jgi:hypothetical protein
MQLPALAFQKEGHWIVKLASFINGSATLNWQVITPQLMGRAVIRLGFSWLGGRIEMGAMNRDD